MKCPCENCLTLVFCRNLEILESYHFITCLNKCPMLQEFLKVEKIYMPTNEFWCRLEKNELDIRLDIAKKQLLRKGI
ncbi:MAG: hypothetical protein ACFFG0_00485 [Candidatus Thorarchaeota archaeon]